MHIKQLTGNCAKLCASWMRARLLKVSHRNTAKIRTTHMPVGRLCILLMLSLAGDVESNPGPVKYPCQICEKPVRMNQKGVACDSCDQWYRITLSAWAWVALFIEH